MRRMFWLAAGVGTSWWVRRKARTTLERYRPEQLGADIAGSVRRLGGDVRAAVAEGATAMREREAAIRREIGDPRAAARAVDAAVIERRGGELPSTPPSA